VLSTLLEGLQHWMEEHGYTSIDEFRGAMNLSRCPDPAAFERANYQRILQSWRL
jgi:dihydroorotate dehydrogenase (fumarate)